MIALDSRRLYLLVVDLTPLKSLLKEAAKLNSSLSYMYYDLLHFSFRTCPPLANTSEVFLFHETAL